jgi:hypothetical protein
VADAERIGVRWSAKSSTHEGILSGKGSRLEV